MKLDNKTKAIISGALLLIVFGSILQSCSVSQSPCDKMRAADKHIADLEARLNDSEHPENAPGIEELMKAYDDAAAKTDACSASIHS